MAADTKTKPAVLFTAFEPSGDAHAAPVIRELLERAPGLTVYAWGGPRMEEAGATIVERTAEDGSMALAAVGRILAMRREIKRIKRWAKQYRVLGHVAVDSPAANFPICRIMQDAGARVIHLVAPQVWAWGRWRVGKLRRRTDLVLCLLPFEEQWFKDRKVPARFVGHPVMARPVDEAEVREQMRGLPQGAPRVAIFPGSRSHEVKANIRLLVNVYTELQGRHHGLGGVIVAASSDVASVVRRKVKVFPHGLHMVVGQTDAAIGWCDLALAVSGTITLQIARQCKPMVAVYKTGLISWLGAQLIVRTPFRILPNIVAEREIVPEFVPYAGGPMPVVRQASQYLLDSKNAAVQSEELRRVTLRFANKKPAEESARLILKVLKHGKVE